MTGTADGSQVVERIRTALVEWHDVMGYQLPVSRTADSAGVSVALQHLRPQSAPSKTSQTARPAAFPVVMILAANLGCYFSGSNASAQCITYLVIAFFSISHALNRFTDFAARFLRVDTFTQFLLRFFTHGQTFIPCRFTLLYLAHLALGFFRVRLVVPLGWRRFIPKRVAVFLPSFMVLGAETVTKVDFVASLNTAISWWSLWSRHVLILTHKLNYCNGIAVSCTETLTKGDE